MKKKYLKFFDQNAFRKKSIIGLFGFFLIFLSSFASSDHSLSVAKPYIAKNTLTKSAKYSARYNAKHSSKYNSRYNSKHKSVDEKKSEVTPKIKKKIPLIILDAGHGGKDTGARSTKNDYEEKILTLHTVNMVKSYLLKMGYQVVLTRKNDIFIALEDRAQMANEKNADLFVSIHFNYSPNGEAEGIEIFYYKDEKNPYTKRLIESRRLGEDVLSGIVKHTGANGRGVKRANFAVIRETKMPAILVEGGFLSNVDERRRILDVPYRQFLAFGIASGIDRYLNTSGVNQTMDPSS